MANTFLEGPEYKVLPICLGWNLNGTQVPSENSIVAGWGRTDKRPVHGGGDFENSGVKYWEKYRQIFVLKSQSSISRFENKILGKILKKEISNYHTL